MIGDFLRFYFLEFRIVTLISFSWITSVDAWEPGPSQADAVTDLSVETTNRNDVVSFYHCIYQASEEGNSNIAWTGSVGNCQPGATSSDFKEHVRRRINWFRAMAGVPADINFDQIYNQKCQDAAFMMAQNNSLSHYPPDSWSCYTAGGAEAARNGNLAIGDFGVSGVDLYIQDPGAGNIAVGHRRWLLAPRVKTMGTGDIPKTDTREAANCIWVIGGNRSPSLPAMTSAWPPAGFVPWNVIYERWSYSYGGANFANANITMTLDGQNVPLTIESRTNNGFGDNTIVWNAPSTVGPVSTDQTYSITITGIQNVSPSTVSYDVTVIDPNLLTDEIVIQGANEIPSTGGNYQFNEIAGASRYELSVSQVVENDTSEGAENGTSSFVLDGTADGNYRSDSLARSGSRSFHLSPPDFFQSEYFELDRDFLTGDSSELVFHLLEGFATNTTVLRAEISTNGGGSWSTVWEMAGKASADSSYRREEISLGEYSNQTVRVRFITEHLSGSMFMPFSDNIGFRLDDITITDSTLESDTQLTDLGTSLGFSLNSLTAGRSLTENDHFILKVRPVIGCHTFGFSTPYSVLINEEAPVDGFTTWLANYPGASGGLTGDPDQDGIENGVEYLIGTSPLEPTSHALLPKPQREGNTVTMTVANTIGLSGIEIKMAVSEDLENWTLYESDNDGPDHSFSVDVGQTKTFFLRLVVTAAP